MNRRGLSVAALAGLCLVIAGCSVSTSGHGHLGAAGGRGGFPQPSSSSAARHVPPVRTPGAGHIALAKIPLHQRDLPPGWTASKSTDTGGDRMDSQLAACIGGHTSNADEIATVNGDDFSQTPSQISSSVSKYKTQADIDNDVRLITGPKVNSCLTKSLRRAMKASAPPGGQIDSVSFHVTPGSSGGPHNVVATGSGRISLSAAGQSIRVYLDIAFITGRRIEAEVDFTGLGAPVDAGLQASLIAKVAGRAARA